MSKFIEKLKRFSQTAPEPIGFRTRQGVPTRHKIQVVASLTADNLDSIADLAACVDALLLQLDSRNLDNLPEAISDVPWGVRLTNGSPSELQEITKAGGDFVVFPVDTPLAILDNADTGKILEVEVSLDHGLVMTTGRLPVDALVVISGLKEGEPLTMKHLMLIQRFAAFPEKPLVVSTPASITSGELQSLWRAGVDCLLIESSAQNLDKLKELRQTIDSMTFPLPRRREQVSPVLPVLGAEPGVPPEEEEEGDDE
ncbi:MAG: hypothetical protein HYX83_01495 [Chloroflexi bacterium]|nr:hypothetical protein [Chloroflexota bacterium]